MKVLLINGSPKPAGSTFTALKRVADTLEGEGISTEIYHVGTKPVAGCMGCGYCSRSGYGKCINDNDGVNEVISKLAEFDGFVFGSPVHYAAASGMLTSFLDRLFYAGKKDLVYKPGAAVVCCRRGGATAALDQITKYFTISNMPVVSSHYAAASGMLTSFLDRLFYAGKKDLVYKPGAAVVCCRRGGATAALDQITKYFTISNMPVVSSQYWNMVHGNNPEEVVQDLEGMQTMEVVGKNMAWLLKCIEAGKNNGINKPELEAKISTNFIR